MKPYTALVLLATLLAAAPPATAQNVATRATLPNGLRVMIVTDRLAPVVATEVIYLTGSNDAPDGFPGTAHALEHMMFRGSAGLDREQLAELGAQLGGDYNADTTETVTRYTYTVAAGDLGVVLRAEALRMRGLSLTQADWEQERGAIEQEVSGDLSNPLYNYFSQLQAILFAGTPYEHDALGTRDSFDRTDTALLRRFYEDWYAPNNAVLVIAGDVDPARALSDVRAAFGDIPSRPLPEHIHRPARAIETTTIELPTDFPIGVAGLAYRMPGLKDPDFPAADILIDVLGSQRGALYGLVPAGRALFADMSYRPKPDVGLAIAMAGFPTGGDPEPLLAEMRRVLAAAAQGEIPPGLVDAAKQQEIARLAFARNSISGLARSWSRAVTLGDLASPDDLAHAYAAVTPADVARLARQLLDPAHAVTAILTPRHSGRAPTPRGFGGAESFAAPPDHPVTLPEWAVASPTALATSAETDSPEITVLPNGLRLIVQPQHVSPTVSVYGHVRQVKEMQEPQGREGVAALTGALFEYGTRTMDRLALLKAVDDIAAELNAGTDFSLKVLTPRFEAGMRLLADNELHPAFPDAALEVVRGQLAQTVAGLLPSPDYRFDRAVKAALAPPGDPTLRQATPETVAALTRADVLAFHAAAYRPDLTTLVVIGDITPAQARDVVERTFGEWAAPGATPAIDLPPVGPSPPSQARVADASSLQDAVTLTQTIGMPVDSPDRFMLRLGNVILGSGFSSRLYRDLRARTGYVYSVNSSLDWTRTRATWDATFGADAASVGRAKQLVLSDVRAMQTTLVSEAELARAKAEVLRQLYMQHESVARTAAVYLYRAELGLPIDATTIAARRYADVTAEDIRRAFVTWLRPDGLSEISKGPDLVP